MSTVVPRAKSDAVITMRVSAHTRDLIDDAAATQGKSRTEFMVESARRHAIDVLLDQRIFSLDGDGSDALADILARPARPDDALRDLMTAKVSWT